MSVKNEAVSSFTDLITKLDTHLATVGWTAEHLDTTSTAGTGGEWAMRRTGTNLRFATSWDGAGTPTNLAIYQYVDQNYVIGNRPWGQHNDSGNGFTASTPNASIVNERHAIIGSTPIQYWAFEGDLPSPYTYIVVETAAGVYAHFGFGILDKGDGVWIGGEFVFGQRNNLSTVGAPVGGLDGMSFLLDGNCNDTPDTGGFSNGMELVAATIHCEGMPNQVAGGQWGVCMGGKIGSPQTDFGLDRQSNDGSSSDTARSLFTWGYRGGPFAQAMHRQGHSISGELGFWPIATVFYDHTTGDVHGFPIGFMPQVFGCSMANYIGQEVILDEAGSSYYIFPANVRGTGVNSSVYLGIAYREEVYVDPGLPASVPTPSGWYSTREAADYTESSGEITQLDDKSGNGNHLTVPATKTGPALVTIDGRTWADFPVAGGRVLSVTNTDIDPGAGDFSMVAVYRAVDSGNGPGCIAGKIGTGNPNFGLFVGVSNSRSLYFQMRHVTDTTTELVEHDDAGTDYTDGTTRLACVTYDDSQDQLILYGDDFITPVAINTAAPTDGIAPSNDLFFGDWSSSYDRAHEGETAELLFAGAVLGGTARLDLRAYLKAKWGK